MYRIETEEGLKASDDGITYHVKDTKWFLLGIRIKRKVCARQVYEDTPVIPKTIGFQSIPMNLIKV